jgi:hypothetical protein
MLSSQPLFIEPQRRGRITAIWSAIQRKPMVLVLGIGAEIATLRVGLPRLAKSERQRSQRSVPLPRRYLASRMTDVRSSRDFLLPTTSF